jgi:hypothetical protein
MGAAMTTPGSSRNLPEPEWPELILSELQALRSQLDAIQASLPDPVISEREAASMIGYSLSGLRKLRQRGAGPLFMRTSERSRVNYRRSAVLAWLSRSEPGRGQR